MSTEHDRIHEAALSEVREDFGRGERYLFDELIPENALPEELTDFWRAAERSEAHIVLTLVQRWIDRSIRREVANRWDGAAERVHRDILDEQAAERETQHRVRGPHRAWLEG